MTSYGLWITLVAASWTLGQGKELFTIQIQESSDPVTVTFDACQVINCGGWDSYYMGSDKYLCWEGWEGGKGSEIRLNPCPTWDAVWWTTQAGGWTSSKGKCRVQLQDMVKFFKLGSSAGCTKNCNPVAITFLEANRCRGDGDPCPIESVCIEGTYGFGIDLNGKDPVGRFKVVVIPSNQTYPTPPTSDQGLMIAPDSDQPYEVFNVTDLKTDMEVELGYGEGNVWLDWAQFSAKSLNRTNCSACAQGRANLIVVPFPFNFTTFPEEYTCILALFCNKSLPSNCSVWDTLYPPFPPQERGRPRVNRGFQKLDCLGTDTSSPPSWCRSITQIDHTCPLTRPRSDLWWICDPKSNRLLQVPTPQATCALVQLAIPFTPEKINRLT